MTRLDEIKKRIEASTPGPWRKEGNGAVWGPCGDTGSMRVAMVGYASFDESNTNFIAHSRTDLPALVEVVDAARDCLESADGDGHHRLEKALAEFEKGEAK